MNFENFPQEASTEEEKPKKKKTGFFGTVAAAVGIMAGGVMSQEKSDDGIIKGFGFESSGKNIESVEGGKEFDVDAMFASEVDNSSKLSVKKANLSGDAVPLTSEDILEKGEAWSVSGKNLKEVEANARQKEAEAKRRMDDKKKDAGDFTVSMRD